MSSVKILSYIARDSAVHRLSGATKLIVFLIWTIICMLTYDTRVLVVVSILSISVFVTARIKFSEISFVLYFIMAFLLLNGIAIYLFSPQEGVKIYGTTHEIFRFSDRYTVTLEQLFYQLNVTLKYFTIVPVALVFILTTNPSEFSAALSKLKVPYRIAYAVSITLRYIADIQTDFQHISQSQQARGVDLSGKATLKTRISSLANIAVPLIFSSLDRINSVSNAMDLRGFGKNPSRTWYRAQKLTRTDWIIIAIAGLIGTVSIAVTMTNATRFYNPFL